MPWYKKHAGTIGIYLVCLVPIVLWVQTSDPEIKFASTILIWTSVAQLFGLVGFTLFSISIFLSSRLKLLEQFFPGMNRVYITHHIVGSLALVFLVAHSLAITISYTTLSYYAALTILLPGKNWALNFGIAAFLLLVSLIILSIYVKIPYHIWRFTHKFMGLAYVLGSLHSLLIPSDISQKLELQIYSFMLIIACLGLYSFRTLFGRWLVPRYAYTLRNLTQLPNNCIELELDPVKSAMNFTPGQFVFISFYTQGVSTETHPFSISSAGTSSLKLTVKTLGDWTKTLKGLKPGAQAKIEGPFGAFSYTNYANHRQVWIAGGIGITPFLSMARSLNSPNFSIDLYYSLKDESEAVYLPELTAIAQNQSNFKFIPWYSATMGRISGEAITKQTTDPKACDYFLCGPPPMMFSLRQQLRQKGVKGSHIHSEEFSIN